MELKRAIERGKEAARRTEERKDLGLETGGVERKEGERAREDGEEMTRGRRKTDGARESDERGTERLRNASRCSGRENQWIEKRSTMRTE